MDQTPSTSPTPESTPEVTHPAHIPMVVEKKQSHVKMFVIGLFTTIILIALLTGAYFVGQQRANKKPAAVEATIQPTELIPNPTKATQARAAVPITADTISFTRKNGVLYLRYRDKIYQDQEADAIEPKIVDLSDENSLTWIGLINAPKNVVSTFF